MVHNNKFLRGAKGYPQIQEGDIIGDDPYLFVHKHEDHFVSRQINYESELQTDTNTVQRRGGHVLAPVEVTDLDLFNIWCEDNYFKIQKFKKY